MSQCKYCGSKQYGACSKSPHKKHEHSGGSSDQCVWCGGKQYGSCYAGVEKHHKHHSNGINCVWCGSKQPGGSCPFSPIKRHER